MIRVMGAGAFGTALAIALSAVQPVTLWSRDPQHLADMEKDRRNDRHLPGIAFPEGLSVGDDVSTQVNEATLLAVPAQKLRGFCAQFVSQRKDNAPLVICCKGVELSTGLRPSEVVKEVCPNATVAVLTGPSFASDIARGLPTALTLACSDEAIGQKLQSRLSAPTLRVYTSEDVIGAELGGALKNVVAIACGAVIGADLGESARAALMTRGFAEMVRIAKHMGADPATLNGLSGFGDLVLTCVSEQSRNFRFGLSLGRNQAFSNDVTVEGVATAGAVTDLADRLGFDLPITRTVTLLAKRELKVTEAMDMLLSRPLKNEICRSP